MNHRSFLALTAGAASLTGQSSAETAAKDDGWPTRETLNKLFRQYVEYFRSHLSERYKALPLEIGVMTGSSGEGMSRKAAMARRVSRVCSCKVRQWT